MIADAAVGGTPPAPRCTRSRTSRRPGPRADRADRGPRTRRARPRATPPRSSSTWAAPRPRRAPTPGSAVTDSAASDPLVPPGAAGRRPTNRPPNRTPLRRRADQPGRGLRQLQHPGAARPPARLPDRDGRRPARLRARHPGPRAVRDAAAEPAGEAQHRPRLTRGPVTGRQRVPVHAVGCHDPGPAQPRARAPRALTPYGAEVRCRQRGRPGAAIRVLVALLLVRDPALRWSATSGRLPTPRRSSAPPSDDAAPRRRTSSTAPAPSPPAPDRRPSTRAQLSIDDPASSWVVVDKARPLAPLDYAPADLVVHRRSHSCAPRRPRRCRTCSPPLRRRGSGSPCRAPTAPTTTR